MADIAYNAGLDVMSGFVAGTFRFLLLKNGVGADPDLVYVDDLTPGTNEITVSGYSRQTAGTKSRTVDNTLNRITYDCDDPAFGTLVAGETVTGMVLYEFVTNDADSILVAYYDLTDAATAGTAFTVVLASTGCYYVDQG